MDITVKRTVIRLKCDIKIGTTDQEEINSVIVAQRVCENKFAQQYKFEMVSFEMCVYII